MEQIKPNRIGICSDSSSALKSVISTRGDREDLLVEIYILVYRLITEGIIGNETADKLAKAALKKNLVDIKVEVR